MSKIPTLLRSLLAASGLLLASGTSNAAPSPSISKPTPIVGKPVPIVNRQPVAREQRANPVSLAPPKASRPPSLSRQFYVARDGWPSNGGFVSGSRRDTTLKPGAIIGRRGDGAGRYATTAWAPKPGSLGLYPKADRQPMRYWRVQRPVKAATGKVAPAWSAQGGGNQLLLSNRPDTLERHGFMRRTITPNFKMAAKRR